MKKFIALLLSVSMVISFAACSNGNTASETEAATNVETKAAETKAAETKAAETKAAETKAAETEAASDWKSEHPTWLCEEKETLSILTYDGVNDTFLPPSNDLPFWQYMEDRTNVHIEWEIVPYAGYKEVIAARLAAGTELPDIIMCNSVENANSAGKNGLLVDLAPYWDSCFANTKAYMEDVGMDYLSLVKQTDGAIYAITGSSDAKENHIIFMYNTLWMEKLGAKVPTTLDEFTALLRQMKEAGDLNGNGQDDEVILSSVSHNHLGTILWNAFDIEQYESSPNFVADANGVVTDDYTSDKMRNYLTYLNMLYGEGLLDEEINTMTADRLSEKVAADRVGVFVYNSAFAVNYGKLTTAGQADPMGEYYTLGGPLASEYNGNENKWMLKEKISTCPTAISTECKNIELAAKWIDVLFADPDVLITRTCGFEGEDFEYDENGNIKLIYAADGTPWNITDKGCGQISLCYNQTKEQTQNSKLAYTWYIDEYNKIRDASVFYGASVPKVNTFTDEEQELIDDSKTDVMAYFEEMRDKFVKGDADIAAEWDSYVANMQSLGLDKYTAAYQSVYDRLKK